ncbi:MAG: ATP-binding cassette domain-containing protein, partial [Acidimicrobiales bacterium]
MIQWDQAGFAPPDHEPVWRDVTQTIRSHDIHLVVGESGSGKSTLLRSVNGLVPHTSGGHFWGTVTVADRSTVTHLPRDLADTVGFVHQDPAAHVVVDQVEHEIAFGMENLGVGATDMRRRVEEVLDALGIASLRQRAISSLSGGERQRVAVAAALATARDVLLLDEPTAELDPQGADDVFAALRRLNEDLGITVVMAEHRLERAAPLADSLSTLRADSTRVEFSDDPATALAGYAGAPPVTHLGRLLDWHPEPLTVRDARRMAATADPLPAPPPPAPTTGETLVSLAGAGYSHGDRRTIRDISVAVHQGETVAALGRNGAGKTTMLRLLAGLVEPDTGRQIGEATTVYLPQDPNLILTATSVLAELSETRRLRGTPPDPGADRLLLETLGLAAVAERHPRSLSGGERQRVALAAVAAADADVMLLDEPTRGIDMPTRAGLARLFRHHTDRGGAV